MPVELRLLFPLAATAAAALAAQPAVDVPAAAVAVAVATPAAVRRHGRCLLLPASIHLQELQFPLPLELRLLFPLAVSADNDL